MCTCLDKSKINFQKNPRVITKKTAVKVHNGWRRKALFRIEKLIREVDQDSRAKRMGMCGNTIFVKAGQLLFYGEKSCLIFMFKYQH